VFDGNQKYFALFIWKTQLDVICNIYIYIYTHTHTQNLAVRATWCLRFVTPGLDFGPNYTKEPTLVQTDTS